MVRVRVRIVLLFPDWAVSRPHFSCLPKKMGLETAYSIFIKLYRNAGALLFSNIMLDVIEDYIPHYVPTIC